MHTLYIFSAIIFCILTVQCAEQNVIKSVNEQVGDHLLLFTDRSRFSHEDLMAFGLTCKSNHTYLRATSQKRKNYCLVLMSMVEAECNSFQWHGYGSRADKKVLKFPIKFSSKNKKYLTLERLELSCNGDICKYYGWWNGFVSELSFKSTPFFDENKTLCLIGCGWKNKCEDIYMYQASKKIICSERYDTVVNEQKQSKCLLQFESDKISLKSLIDMVHFPHLLKAILNSTEKEENHTFVGDNLFFHLKGVTLPANYQEYVWENNLTEGASVISLDDNLKHVLEKRYEEQQKGNNS